MIYAHRTDVGRRSSNQDFFFVPEKNEPQIAIVADGMGGHKAGNVASLFAVETISRYASENAAERPALLLQQAIAHANRRIFDIAADDEACSGMGTTVVAAYVEPNGFTYANVGDSRLYLFDGERIRQITRDHSLVEEMVQSGVITRRQANVHPQRNILTRAVGTSRFVQADTGTVRWKNGDTVMLCSDGLHGSVSEREMESILSLREDLLDACDALTETALENGSSDNITVVLIRNTEGAL